MQIYSFINIEVYLYTLIASKNDVQNLLKISILLKNLAISFLKSQKKLGEGI